MEEYPESDEPTRTEIWECLFVLKELFVVEAVNIGINIFLLQFICYTRCCCSEHSSKIENVPKEITLNWISDLLVFSIMYPEINNMVQKHEHIYNLMYLNV